MIGKILIVLLVIFLLFLLLFLYSCCVICSRCSREKFDFEIYSYTKDHYLMAAVLKDKNENRFISVMIRELSCFKDRMYKGVELRYMKNSKMASRTVVTSVSWNEIGITARRILECRKNLEKRNEEDRKQKDIEIEMER